MKIHLVNFPMKYGCHIDGADTSFEPLQHSGWCTNIDKLVHIPIPSVNTQSLPVENIIIEAAHKHQQVVTNIYQNQAFPLSFGGDHTCALGSVSATLNHFKDEVTVVWLDAHADTHTFETSPSQNMHGMPLGILQGLCPPPFKMHGATLQPHRLLYLGLNSYETFEMQYITTHNIPYLTLATMKTLTREQLFTWITKHITTPYVYLSFDCDVLNPHAFFAVNVNATRDYTTHDGLDIPQVLDLFTYLCTHYACVGCDIVEYNPTLDTKHNDFNTIVHLLQHTITLAKANPYTNKKL